MPAEDKTLQSWKEIADCLGVTVRTVQRWEKMAGLPVYRRGAGPKARVFAYPEELRQWVQAGGPGSAAPEQAATPPRPSRRGLWLGLAGVALLAGLGALWLKSIPGEPHEWILEGTALKVLDSHQRLCWTKRFPPFGNDYEGLVFDKALVEDIEGDGRKEVLFNDLPANLPEGGSLLCFEGDGRLRWKHHHGTAKQMGGSSYSAAYRGALIRTVPIGGRPYLLTVANHYLWPPSQVSLLDPATGRTVEEYWHPGSLYRCILHDLDGDGRPEALLSGINNPGEGLGHAALVALTLPFSRAPRPAAAPDLPPAYAQGGELAYRLFPTSDVLTAMGILPIPERLAIERDRILFQIPLPEHGGIVYYLDSALRVRECHFSDNFAPLHLRLEKAGLLDHSLSPRERELLGRVAALPAAPAGNSPEVARLWKQ